MVKKTTNTIKLVKNLIIEAKCNKMKIGIFYVFEKNINDDRDGLIYVR